MITCKIYDRFSIQQVEQANEHLRNRFHGLKSEYNNNKKVGKLQRAVATAFLFIFAAVQILINYSVHATPTKQK